MLITHTLRAFRERKHEIYTMKKTSSISIREEDKIRKIIMRKDKNRGGIKGESNCT